MLYEPGNACEICGKEEEKLGSCRMCYSRVCRLCQVVGDNICINCHEAMCQICGEFLASRACNMCGKLVCEDHGIRVSESTICDDCRKSDE